MNNLVLAAIDIVHQDQAGPVLSRARQLAELDGASMAVMTVVPDFGMSIVGGFFPEDAAEKAHEATAAALHATVTEHLGSDDNIQHIVAVGAPYEEILSSAKTVGASIIVIGAHKPGFTDYLLGPNAARVVRHSSCSVYVVRD